MNCELMLTYDTPTYSRNLTGPKTLPTLRHTYMKLVTKYQISAINSCWEKYLGWTERQTDRGKTVYPPPVERGYNYIFWGKMNIFYINTSTACPQVFSSGGTCTLLPSFLGIHPNFWECNVPFNSSFGGTKKMYCIFLISHVQFLYMLLFLSIWNKNSICCCFECIIWTVIFWCLKFFGHLGFFAGVGTGSLAHLAIGHVSFCHG